MQSSTAGMAPPNPPLVGCTEGGLAPERRLPRPHLLLLGQDGGGGQAWHAAQLAVAGGCWPAARAWAPHAARPRQAHKSAQVITQVLEPVPHLPDVDAGGSVRMRHPAGQRVQVRPGSGRGWSTHLAEGQAAAGQARRCGSSAGAAARHAVVAARLHGLDAGRGEGADDSLAEQASARCSGGDAAALQPGAIGALAAGGPTPLSLPLPPGAAQPLPGCGAVRPSRRCGAGCAAASDRPSTPTSRTRARAGLEAPAGSPGCAARLQGGRRASAALDPCSEFRPTVGGSPVWLPRALHRIAAAPMPLSLSPALAPANRNAPMASRLRDGRCVPASQGPLLAQPAAWVNATQAWHPPDSMKAAYKGMQTAINAQCAPATHPAACDGCRCRCRCRLRRTPGRTRKEGCEQHSYT